LCRRMLCILHTVSSSLLPYLNSLLGLCPPACYDRGNYKSQIHKYVIRIQIWNKVSFSHLIMYFSILISLW
jgi:hypothetical protein